MLAFVISLPRNQKDPNSFRLMIKGGSCFNLFGGTNVLINRDYCRGCYEYTIGEDKKISARSVSQGSPLENEEWEVHGIGWLRDVIGIEDETQRFVSSQTVRDKVNNTVMKNGTGLRTSHCSDIFKSHFAYREKLSKKEKAMKKLFQKVSRDTEGHNIAEPFLRMVHCKFSFWYDLVGTDRRMTMAIGYLMSFRNTAENISTGGYNNEISSPTLWDPLYAQAVRYLMNHVDKPIHYDFLLSMFCHSGSDSEIFVHAGPLAVCVGLTEGFFGLEQYCNDYETLDKTKRYYKGQNSSDLRTRLSKRFKLPDEYRTLDLCGLVSSSSHSLTYNIQSYMSCIWSYNGDTTSYEREIITSAQNAINNSKANKSKLQKLVSLLNCIEKIGEPLVADSGDKEVVKDQAKGFRQWIEQEDMNEDSYPF
jgi:hypothetical protein